MPSIGCAAVVKLATWSTRYTALAAMAGASHQIAGKPTPTAFGQKQKLSLELLQCLLCRIQFQLTEHLHPFAAQ